MCEAQGEFFLFVHGGFQRLKYSSRYLRKVGKENKLQLPSQDCTSFLCAESRVISEPESCPFPWQAVGIIPLFTKILGQGSQLCSKFYKLWKDLHSHIAKWLFGVM